MTFSMGVIGCGKMAYALLKGIIQDEAHKPDLIYTSDPDQLRLDLFASDFNATSLAIDDLIKKSDIVLLAVKPGQVEEVLKTTHGCWDDRKIMISVAAGIKTADLEKALSDQLVHVVRVMPNTPSMVGEGMSAICAGSRATDSDLDMVQALLSTSGKVIKIQEHYMDAVTAVSGSGPAYIFLLVEAMQEAAVNIGLSSDTARSLVLQTIKGSISMLDVSGEHPAILKQQVCSPGGTTIAAIRKLEEGGVRQAFFNAIEASYNRSQELGNIKK